jgi:hypothetical protein
VSFLDEAKRKKSLGQRGKKPEDKIQEVLADLGKQADFDWERIYDARSAGGKFPTRAADFAFYWPGTHGLIEVKEVKHDYRVPAGNFNSAQVGRMYKRQLAGGLNVILVYHSSTDLWRCLSLDYVRQVLDSGAASFDLRKERQYTCAEEALQPVIAQHARAGYA